MKERSNAKDIAACTDNAANFKKAFIDIDEDDDDFIPLKDLKKEDKFYRSLIQTMKSIPAKMSLLTRKQLKQYEIPFFPPIQSQRWNSVFICLNYMFLI